MIEVIEQKIKLDDGSCQIKKFEKRELLGKGKIVDT